MPEIGRVLMMFGAVLVVIGLALTFSDRFPFLGRLPGDVVIRREGFTCVAPLATSLLLSILLTVILTLLSRLGGR